MRNRYYVGIHAWSGSITRKVFQSPFTPAQKTHTFAAVIGPFRTKRAAEFMRDAINNPHCRCVADAERISKEQTK